MSDSDDEHGKKTPQSSFTTYMSEGNQLYRKGEYEKATESFTKALTLKPNDKFCLVARSKCYLKRGDHEKALGDAEASLKEDKLFYKGMYQKAEALYIMGDFEFALVFYHRGNKLRPELQQFRLGIHKAEKAIDNALGSTSSVKLENTGDLSIFHKGKEHLRMETKQQKKNSAKSEKITKQLLGPFYRDKKYLEGLLNDEALPKHKPPSGEKMQDLIQDYITYLDTWTDFWHKEKPIYARESDQKLMRQQRSKSYQRKSPDVAQFLLRCLEEIDADLTYGNAECSLKKAQKALKIVRKWSEEVVPNKKEVLGSLHSCIGNAWMELGDMDNALIHYQKDLDLAIECNLPDAKSRALDHIGCVYARTGKFRLAIEAWEEKIPMACDGLEKTWLFHEIGRCYLELKHHTESRDYGLRSLTAADEIADEKWQLNASVLVALSESKLRNFESCVLHFERALEQAKILQNDRAVEAILKALQEAGQNLTQEGVSIQH
ncbi:hypothetical protein LDENG_00290970 [Lucifuga dentata]|nr:hypothetical protein LDENG_00290970 [Lucifuga dentata]